VSPGAPTAVNVMAALRKAVRADRQLRLLGCLTSATGPGPYDTPASLAAPHRGRQPAARSVNPRGRPGRSGRRLRTDAEASGVRREESLRWERGGDYAEGRGRRQEPAY